MTLLLIVLIAVSVNGFKYETECGTSLCLKCSDDGKICYECPSMNYYLDPGTHQCRFKPGYSTVSTKSCGSGFEYNTLSGECELVDTCSYYDNDDPTMCSNCIYGANYGVLNGQCVNCDSQLEGCSGPVDGTCAQCNFCDNGYYKDATGKCQFDANANVMYSCKMGYYKVNGICVEGVENCVQQYQEGVCSKCAFGYYLTNGTCDEITIPNCLQTANNEICTACAKSYGLNETGHCVECTNEECDMCNTVTTCSKCKAPLVLAKDNNGNPKCVQPLEGCSTIANGGTTCSYCTSGYYLNSANQCEKCSYDTCSTEHASKCSYHCVQSETGGYVANPGKCTTTMEVNGQTICKSCPTGYYLKSDFTCGKCDDNCNLYCYGDASTCYCSSTYISNCVTRSDDQCKCVECERNFEAVNGECVRKTYGCLYYNAKGECIECYKNYISIPNQWGTLEETFDSYPPTDGKCTSPPTIEESETCPTGWTKNNQNQCIYDCSSDEHSVVNNENNDCVCVETHGFDGSKCTLTCEGTNVGFNADKTACVCSGNYVGNPTDGCTTECLASEFKRPNKDHTACVCAAGYIDNGNGQCIKYCDETKYLQYNSGSGSCQCINDNYQMVNGLCKYKCNGANTILNQNNDGCVCTGDFVGNPATGCTTECLLANHKVPNTDKTACLCENEYHDNGKGECVEDESSSDSINSGNDVSSTGNEDSTGKESSGNEKEDSTSKESNGNENEESTGKESSGNEKEDSTGKESTNDKASEEESSESQSSTPKKPDQTPNNQAFGMFIMMMTLMMILFI